MTESQLTPVIAEAHTLQNDLHAECKQQVAEVSCFGRCRACIRRGKYPEKYLQCTLLMEYWKANVSSIVHFQLLPTTARSMGTLTQSQTQVLVLHFPMFHVLIP